MPPLIRLAEYSPVLKSLLVVACLLLPLQAMATPKTLVPEESQIEFVVKEMGVPVSGRFKRFDMALDFDPARPEHASAWLRIDVGSLSTGNEEADAIAVDADWMDKARAPFAEFRSTSIRILGPGRFEASGTLTMRNRQRVVSVQFASAEGPGGRTILNGSFVIRRRDFGIGGGVWNQDGVVAEEIPVKAHLTFVPASTTSRPKP